MAKKIIKKTKTTASPKQKTTRPKSKSKPKPKPIETPVTTETTVPEIVLTNKGFFSKFFRWRWRPNLCPAFLDDIVIQLLIVIPLIVMLGLIAWKVFS